MATQPGWTPYCLQQSTSSNNATVVKASPGSVCSIEVFNLAAYPIFIKFYDKAATPNPGTDTVVKSILVPNNATATNGAGLVIAYPSGIAFQTGISFAIVKGKQIQIIHL